jgi:hypothetical protein
LENEVGQHSGLNGVSLNINFISSFELLYELFVNPSFLEFVFVFVLVIVLNPALLAALVNPSNNIYGALGFAQENIMIMNIMNIRKIIPTLIDNLIIHNL